MAQNSLPRTVNTSKTKVEQSKERLPFTIERITLQFKMQDMIKGDMEMTCTRSVTTPPVTIKYNFKSN